MTSPERARSRARDRLEALAGADLGLEEGQRAAVEALRPAVGFVRWCWPLTDPASALSCGGTAEFDLWREIPRIAALEEHGDVTRKPSLALAPRASTALSAATGGDLARSRRWRECLSPYGVGDELMTICRDAFGFWGSVELMRDAGDRSFDEDDLRFLDELAPTLGRLLRRGRLRDWGRGGSERGQLAPGTLIVDAELRPVSWTPSFRIWLAELPPAVYELAVRALTPSAEASALPATVRLRTSAGRWAVLESEPLEGAGAGCVAVGVREATQAELLDLLGRVGALSARERELVALVAEGLATKQLAQRLCISPWTVQDHLKAVFAKTGVRSRRELVSRLAAA